MALIFVPQYTLPFDTEAGTDITWELDILRSYDDAGSVPSWINNPVTPLKGTGNPIKIEWQKDYDLYKPINGSSARIKLLVETEGQYADFNNAGPYEYQVRLRYNNPATQYTSTFTSPNSQLVPAITLPTGSQGTQFSLTEADGTLHRFGYITNGNYRYLDGGLTGTVRKGTAQAVTTATASGSFTIADQGTNQTLSLAGDETSTFAAGDFISRSTLTAQAFRGLFIESVVFDGTNTVLTGTGGGGTTFDTTHTIYRAGPADEIQGDGGFQEYWCGYITPLETDEQVTTFPFEVNYTATDGLALLQDRVVDPKTTEENISPIDTVLRAIYETGLDLPVYIDSKIYEGSNDALISATASSNSFYKDKKLIERITIKEAIEGYLLAFNCKIYQSNGRFYITNASTHGGSGDNETATFKRYVVVPGGTEYTATTDSDSEDLIYTLNGTSTRDLIPAMDDLNLTIRRPAGSVECRPEGLTALEIIENGTFEMVNASGAPDDWNAHPDSIDQTLTTSSVIRLDGQRSLTTGRSRKSLDKSDEIWFQNTNGINIDQAYDFTISFDMLGELLKTSGNDGGRNVLFSFQVFYQTTDAFVTSDLDTDNTSNDPEFLPSYTDRNTDRLYFDFANNEWIIPRFNFSAVQDLNDTYHTIELAGQDLDSWINQSVNIKAVNEWWHEKDERYYNIEPGSLYLRVFYLQTNKQEGRGEDSYQGNETGTVRVYLDNLRLTTQFDNDITDPTFERLQLDYNRTFDYKPRFASGVHELITQKLYPTDTYFREGKVETATLERIVTQQKLNDYRGGNTTDPEQSSLKYYEGTVINNTFKPFAPKDKLSINYADYTEPSCIFNGGIFEVKKNAFKFHGYVPNQSSDIAAGDGTIDDEGVPGAGFYPFNVDLVAAKFPGRSNKVVYTLGFDVATTNSADGTSVEGGLLPITENNGSFIQIVGLPGQVIPMDLRLVPTTNFIGNPAGCTVRANTETEPRPLDTTFGTFKNSQGDVILPLSITLPENSEYEVLYIDGSISPFTPEDTPEVVPNTVVIDWSTDLIAEGSLVQSSSTPPSYRTIFNTDGIPGSVVHFTYFVEARSAGNAGNGWHLFAENFSISENDTSLVNLDARQVGERTIAIDFEYTIPTTPETVPVTLIGAASDPDSIDNPTFDYNVTFNSSGSNFTLFETNNVFKGTEGSVVPYNLLVNPNEGYDLRAGAFSYSSTTSGAINNLPSGISIRSNSNATTGFIQNGEEVVLPINVRIGDADTSGEITISGTPQTEPYSLTFLVNDVGSAGWTIDNSQKLQPYGTTDFDDSIPTFTFYVTPNENMAFSDGDQAHIDNQVMADIDEAAIDLPESQFTIARTYVNTGDEPDDLNVGKIKCVVAGKFPVLTDLPNFPHHATVSINITGTAGISGATSPNDDFTITTTDGNITIVLLNINGGWSLTPNTPIGTPVGGGSAFGVRYEGDSLDTFTTFSPNVGDVINNVIYTTLSESRAANAISIPIFPLGSATALFTITLKKNAATSEGTTSFATEPVLLTGGSNGTVWQYSDYQGQSRVVHAFVSGETTQVCAIDGISGIIELSDNGGTSISPTTGSIVCNTNPASGGETYAADSGSVNGFTIQTLTVAPGAGTADTVITLVPII